MSEALPDPLVPPEVDLRGMEWMPYYGDRLGRSSFNSVCSDSAWRAGHNLWWAAWNNVPASSLPNDEAQLARYADLGRDIKGFRKVKEDALHGFVLCSDGRLYHPFIAELALQAWDKRLKERERKARWRAGTSLKETEWGALRAAVLERDKYKCRNCGSVSNLNCDHIVPVSKGGLTTTDNMQTLCAACNKRKRDRAIMVPHGGAPEERGQDADSHVPGTRERTGEDRRGQLYSDPNGSAHGAPNGRDDPAKTMFDTGVRVLTSRGVPERQARAVLGKCRSELHDDGKLLSILLSVERENPVEPLAYLSKAVANAAGSRNFTIGIG